MIGLLFLACTSAAQAKTYLPKNFFDFDFAQKVWTEFTDPEVDEYLSKTCAKDSAYSAWIASYRSSPQSALLALQDHPMMEEIKRCNDVLMTFEQWNEMYDAWRDPLVVYGSEGWNKNTRGLSCMVIKSLNIFTGQCNDMPDWRHPINAKEDAASMAKGNARWLKKKK